LNELFNNARTSGLILALTKGTKTLDAQFVMCCSNYLWKGSPRKFTGIFFCRGGMIQIFPFTRKETLILNTQCKFSCGVLPNSATTFLFSSCVVYFTTWLPHLPSHRLFPSKLLTSFHFRFDLDNIHNEKCLLQYRNHRDK